MAPNITREQLKAKMDRGDDFVLVEALSQKHYASSHLPGAINLPYEFVVEAEKVLPDRNAEIVVYCMNSGCLASREEARELEEMGYQRVLQYAAGKQDWIRAGLPVVLRDVVREERIPASVRQALNIEAGTNDIVVLPTLLILIALANDEASGVGGWTLLVVKVLVLGPLIGFAIGAGAAWLMSQADRRYSVNEVYQSLYGVGIVLLAYATATVLGGDGFLAAFAAGLTIAILNFDLCQCFLDYGETTSEMAMLLSFILFGVVISDLFTEVPILAALILAAVVIFIARPLAIGLVLRKAAVSNAARAFIGWFGPRGLNSLLLALLVVGAGVSDSEFLLGIVGVVVTVSVVVHGASATPLSRRYGEAVMRETHEEERDDAAGIFEGAASESIRIGAKQLSAMLADEIPPIVLDVRTRSQYEQDHSRIPGAVRVAPDEIDEWAREQRHDSQVEGQRVVAYCT